MASASSVPDWLLLTKLTPPPARPGLVDRPRLLARLERGLRGPLTLVAAPAGFGKTTLLVEWQAAALRELVVAVATVKTHVNGVFRKLGATSRVEAIVKARQLGLVQASSAERGR